MGWTIRIVPKYDNQQHDQQSLLVFGVCDASLIESGYKHKYYSIGYCRTYCHGLHYHSYCTAFPIGKQIKIKYDASKRQISFRCDGCTKDRQINIEWHRLHEHVISIKSYNDAYAVQIVPSS